MSISMSVVNINLSPSSPCGRDVFWQNVARWMSSSFTVESLWKVFSLPSYYSCFLSPFTYVQHRFLSCLHGDVCQ